MKATIKMSRVYSGVLDEEKIEIVFKRGNKMFMGTLFFPKDYDEIILEDLETIHIDGTNLEVILAAYNLLKKYGRLAKDDKTLLTMLHWQYQNYFGDELFMDAYNFDNDTAYLEYINSKKKGKNHE